MIHLVCCDRDGTLNRDEDYFLGKDSNWKKQVEFLPGVVEGIKLLNTLPSLHVCIVTNQSGIALANPEFSSLTESRAEEVTNFIIHSLAEKAAHIKAHFTCPFVDSKYARRALSKGRKIHPQYLKDSHPDIKPGIGMVEKATAHLGLPLEKCNIYSIGDRLSDVQMGLNAGGKGILVPSSKTLSLGDWNAAKSLLSTHPGRVYLATSFLDAAEYIKKDIASLSSR